MNRDSVFDEPPSRDWGERTTARQAMPGGQWRRLSTIGFGHAAYATFNWFFDHVLYVYVVYRYGIVYGGAVMTALSLVQCAATLILYQRMGVDWIGAGFLHQLQDKPNPSFLERLLASANRWPSPVVFAMLCVLQDPFVTTAFFRRGSFGALNARDWRIFLGAVLVSNLYWIFVASALGNALAWAWRLFQSGG